MRLTPTAEQHSLADAVRDWAGATDDLAAARAHPGRPESTGAGLRAAAQLGVLGLLRPDEGGLHQDLAVVVEELGRAGSPVPVGETALALALTEAAGLVGPDLDAVAAGEVTLVTALGSPERTLPLAEPSNGGGLVLTGRVDLVVAAGEADWLLVAGVAADGARVLAVLPTAGPGITVTRRDTLDLTRGIDKVVLDRAAVAAGGWLDGGALVDLLTDVAVTHAVLDAVGAAGLLVERTVAYVGQREQFGRPVGSFQAVKHHCATMALELEAARSTARAAAIALDGTDPVARAHAVSAAAAYAKPACARIAGTAVQLHGGMGFTWEHDVHLLLRRVHADELLAGNPAWHRERLARLLS